MKRTVLLLITLSIIFVSAEAKEKKSKKSKIVVPVIEKIFNNEIDSMSYALGMNVGEDFAKNIAGIPGGKSNIELIVKGFSTAMKGDSTLMTSEFAKEFFNAFITKAQKADVEIKKASGEKFLAENMTQEGVNVTPSGLQYKVIVPAEGKKPSAEDTVRVHYHGTLLDGTVFDSSVNRGEPIEFPLNQVIKGWTEGVQLMPIGSKYKFFIPYNLGYGDQGAGGVIAPYATLIFEIELLGIKTFVEKIDLPTLQTKAINGSEDKKSSKISKTSTEAEINKKYDECNLMLFNGADLKVTHKTGGETTIFDVSSDGIKTDNYKIKIGDSKIEIDRLSKLMGIKFKKVSNKYWVFKSFLMKFQNGKLVEMPGILKDNNLMDF